MSPGSEKIACLSIDLEPDLHAPDLSLRLLEDDNRFEAFVTLLRDEDVPLTSFTQMSEARRHLARLNELATAVSTEFAIHSFSHDQRNPASEDELRRATVEFEDLWNKKAAGYRAPNCLIDEPGLQRLVNFGFTYDSSIVPSYRPDAYAYNNLRFGREPFRFVGTNGSIVELPVGCLGGVRLPFVFSYVKLLGLAAYEAATTVFPLPDVLVTYFHPYDLYAADVAGNMHGWKRHAHMRNGRHGYALLRRVVRMLKRKGYRFVLMRDAAAAAAEHTLTAVDLNVPRAIAS